MAAHRASCFSSSFHAATAQMRAAPDLPCALPAFLKLLHTVMEPAGLYGCELWGLLSIPGLWSSGWTLAKSIALKILWRLSGAVWSVSGCSSLSLCLFCLYYMSLDLNLLCIAMFGVLFAFITALLSLMLLQCIGVPCNRTLMMLSPLALVPTTLWGLFFRCYGSFCPVKVVLLAPCELACLWILMALMKHCILGTLSTSSVCPRLSMVLGPVLVYISGLLVHMFWALSLPFTHVACLTVCWYASCVSVLAAIICASILGVGLCPSFPILNALVCGVAPQ